MIRGIQEVGLFSRRFVIIDQSNGICDQGNKPKHVICQIEINYKNVGLLRRSEKRNTHYCLLLFVPPRIGEISTYLHYMMF